MYRGEIWPGAVTHMELGAGSYGRGKYLWFAFLDFSEILRFLLGGLIIPLCSSMRGLFLYATHLFPPLSLWTFHTEWQSGLGTFCSDASSLFLFLLLFFFST
jgi:hypothetical protein